MRIVYFGSPDFSAFVLEKLSGKVEFKAVVTQPDRPVGRKKVLEETPVAKVAETLSIPTFKLDSLKQPPKILLETLKKADLALVYAFGLIIPKELLSLPKYGFFNIHPSLLPRFRGASPVVYPLSMGEKETGVTIIRMDEYVDHGPIIFQAKKNILEDEKRDDLYFKLSQIAIDFLLTWVKKAEIKPYEQDHSKATYTRILRREDGYLDLSSILKLERKENLEMKEYPKFLKEYITRYPFEKVQYLSLFNLYKALHPWPGLWTFVNLKGEKKRLKILEVEKTERVIKLQLEGKQPVLRDQFERDRGELIKLI